CIGPILVAILALASTLKNAWEGGALLIAYALGIGFPLVTFSIALRKMPKDGKLWKFLKGREFSFSIFGKQMVIHSTSLISGILFLIVGYLIFSGTLYTFNKFVVGTSLQKWFFALEQWLLRASGG
ncbi:cytochrome c biogenesis protein CcdA, partial [Candidatus Peregrinibacteria bacterium CG10_big_fil_rev_8_21_14_0_10_54_7]